MRNGATKNTSGSRVNRLEAVMPRFVWLDGSEHDDPDPNWSKDKALKAGVIKQSKIPAFLSSCQHRRTFLDDLEEQARILLDASKGN